MISMMTSVFPRIYIISVLNYKTLSHHHMSQMTAVERIFSLADLPAEADPNKDSSDKRPSKVGPTEHTGNGMM